MIPGADLTMLALSLNLQVDPCDVPIHTMEGDSNNLRSVPNRDLLPNQVLPNRILGRLLTSSQTLVQCHLLTETPVRTSNNICVKYAANPRPEQSHSLVGTSTTGNFPFPATCNRLPQPTSRTLYSRSIKVLEPSTHSTKVSMRLYHRASTSSHALRPLLYHEVAASLSHILQKG